MDQVHGEAFVDAVHMVALLVRPEQVLNINTALYCISMYYHVLCCTVLYCTALYSTVKYSTVQYSTVQYCMVQYSTVHLNVDNSPPAKLTIEKRN